MYRIALMSDTAAQDMIPSLSLLSHKVHIFPLDTAHTTLESEAFDLLMVAPAPHSSKHANAPSYCAPPAYSCRSSHS